MCAGVRSREAGGAGDSAGLASAPRGGEPTAFPGWPPTEEPELGPGRSTCQGEERKDVAVGVMGTVV